MIVRALWWRSYSACGSQSVSVAARATEAGQVAQMAQVTHGALAIRFDNTLTTIFILDIFQRDASSLLVEKTYRERARCHLPFDDRGVSSSLSTFLLKRCLLWAYVPYWHLVDFLLKQQLSPN